MITQKTISVYKFNDLTDTAKKKALDKHREINVSDDWYESDLYDLEMNIKEKLNLSIDKKEVYFEFMSRSNSVWIESSAVVKALMNKYPELEDLDIPKKFGMFCSYLGGGLCSGLNASEWDIKRITFYQEDDEELKGVVRKKAQEKTREKIGEDLTELQSILEKFYKGLYESYNYLVSDESITDTLEINEYEFDENGECL